MDLSRYRNMSLWSEADLQALCCGLEPNSSRPSDAGLSEAAEAIRRAILAKVLPCIEPVDASDGDRMYGHSRFFRPDDAIRWAVTEFPDFCFKVDVVEEKQPAKPEANQPVNSDSRPAKWRKAFEYESVGLNALYDLIESQYFDASDNPIYDLTLLPLKKNLKSDWLTGRTLGEADTIITSGKRKGKAGK